MIFIRFIIASLGGYIFTSLISITLAFVLPFEDKTETIHLTSMLSFLIWLLFILYSFSNIKIKSLFFQVTLININLFLINSCFMAIKA